MKIQKVLLFTVTLKLNNPIAPIIDIDKEVEIRNRKILSENQLR